MAKAHKQSASGEVTKERPILREVGVSLIVAVLLWLASYIPGVWQFLSTGFWWCWGMVIQEISWPAWALGLLGIGDIVLLVAIVGKIVSWHRANSGPSWRDYTEDCFDGIIWRWQYSHMGGAIIGLWCFCPQDDTALVCFQGPRFAVERETSYRCERCGQDFVTLQGQSREDIKGTVERQIDRKLRNGEWKAVVESQRRKHDAG
ncbi:MAG: hypothetical protein IMZ62_14830 [Chloroflexi bacterium]|nr:hypothetical protein [Chloroflexota bacterium]